MADRAPVLQAQPAVIYRANPVETPAKVTALQKKEITELQYDRPLYILVAAVQGQGSLQIYEVLVQSPQLGLALVAAVVLGSCKQRDLRDGKTDCRWDMFGSLGGHGLSI